VGLTASIVKRGYNYLLDLLLPPRCVVCGKVETWLCDACAPSLPVSRRPICPRCGDAWDDVGLCARCRADPLRVAPIVSVFLFQDAVRDAIHALKYRGGRHVVRPLAERMAAYWLDVGLHSDLLLPVPLHPEREAQRGYNQAALLAIALAPQVEVPVELTILYKIRATASQTHLNWHDRWDNVKDAFACSDAPEQGNGHDLTGLRITLIDDVATTGATLDACAVALLAHGARSVSAFTLAHAV
jgi:ComF family protein